MSSHLRLVVIPQSPIWVNHINGTNCEGVLCHLLKYLSASLNFTYQFIDGTAFEIGDQSSNKTCWTGIMGQFQSNVEI